MKTVGEGRAAWMQGLPPADPRNSSGYLGLHVCQPLSTNTKVARRHGQEDLRISRQAQSCATRFTDVGLGMLWGGTQLGTLHPKWHPLGEKQSILQYQNCKLVITSLSPSIASPSFPSLFSPFPSPHPHFLLFSFSILPSPPSYLPSSLPLFLCLLFSSIVSPPVLSCLPYSSPPFFPSGIYLCK